MHKIYILGVNEVAARYEVFERVGRYLLLNGKLPELSIDNLRKYLDALVQHSQYCNVVVCETTDSIAFSVVEEHPMSPLIDGSGLVLLHTVATSGTALGKLIRWLKGTAKAQNLDWVYVSHRVSAYTYQGKYIKLRSTHG